MKVTIHAGTTIRLLKDIELDLPDDAFETTEDGTRILKGSSVLDQVDESVKKAQNELFQK